MLDLPT